MGSAKIHLRLVQPSLFNIPRLLKWESIGSIRPGVQPVQLRAAAVFVKIEICKRPKHVYLACILAHDLLTEHSPLIFSSPPPFQPLKCGNTLMVTHVVVTAP